MLLRYPLLIFPAILLLSGCSNKAQDYPGSSSSSQVFKVKKGTVEREIYADGLLSSPSSKPIVVERVRWFWDGTIAWTTQEGIHVKEGDLVIKIDPAQVQKELSEQTLLVEKEKLVLEETKVKADDDLAGAKADVTLREFDLKKARLKVVEDDSVSENERQKQKLEVESAKASLSRAMAKVAAIKAAGFRSMEMQRLNVKKYEDEVKDFQDGLAKLDLKAPGDGILIFKLYQAGGGEWQKASPGSSVRVNTVIAEVADPNDLVAKIFVPEVDFDGIRPGLSCQLSLDIQPDKFYPAKIESVSKMPTTAAERDGTKSQKPEQNVREYEVQIRFNDKIENLFPGLSVTAKIVVSSKNDVLTVPLEVLTSSVSGTDNPPTKDGKVTVIPSTEPSGIYVLVKNKNGSKWNRQAVKPGLLSLTQAEIIDGLEEGDLVKAVE